ncbi:MAG: hypothetical protein ACKOQ9_00290, partial [Verrucomicrobiota bacterium]
LADFGRGVGRDGHEGGEEGGEDTHVCGVRVLGLDGDTQISTPTTTQGSIPPRFSSKNGYFY